MNRFPISRAKVTPPPVRDETLARERLLSWLDAAVLRRLVLVVAEAGYGKTTLLADFTRRTRVRCLWYRLDATDRDWLTLVHYIVAAGREAVPDFAQRTEALLRQAATGEPVFELTVETLASELAQLGQQPTAIVFDDFHLIDDAPHSNRIVQRLVRSAPERLSLVLLTRRRPTLSVGRLRSLDELRELGRDDLRFSRDETERLFTEAFKQPLEPDVLEELEAKTEGWAASLQLVRSGIRTRSPAEIRTFVRRLSGAEDHLYNYLAEEVIGELPQATQRFLTRTAILDRVTPELAQSLLAAGTERASTLHEIRAIMQRCEELGLLSRRGGSSRWSHRYHPLTRDFLLRRLQDEVDMEGLRELHRIAARHAETHSWSVAAHHWLEAGEPDEVVATIERQVSSIAASGQYSLAADFLTRAKVENPGDVAGIVQARVDLYAGRHDRARARMQSALNSLHRPDPKALQLLMSVSTSMGEQQAASEIAELLLRTEGLEEWQRLIAKATLLVRDSAVSGHLAPTLAALEEAAVVHEREQRWHLAAISRLNMADIQKIAGEYKKSIGNARLAIDFFRASGGDAMELGSAYAVMGSSMAELDDVHEAAGLFGRAEQHTTVPAFQYEVQLQHAEFLVDIGRPFEGLARAMAADRHLRPGSPAGVLMVAATTGADIATKCYQFSLAKERLALYDARLPANQCAGLAHQMLAEARLSVLTGRKQALDLAEAAALHAERQGASHFSLRARILAAVGRGDARALAEALSAAAAAAPGAIRAEAAAVASVIHLFEDWPAALLASLAVCPAAWRVHFRVGLSSTDPAVRLSSARALDSYGEYGDVLALRKMARSAGIERTDRDLGRRLARQTAPRIFVEDLGRTEIVIGERRIEATSMRRKVAALLGFLLTRPGFTATREQVLEALWPDSPPDVGANSLHQTIYFLRRVLEPRFSEDTTPGYVRFEGELLWLDPELVDAGSRRFLQLAGKARSEGDLSESALAAVQTYRGRFAPEFEYEEWSIATRDSLHAAYLELVERMVKAHAFVGLWSRGAEIARGALAVDPLAEAIERNLIALYHQGGSHAAAAGQYAHFAAAIRSEYGLEPPTLEAIVQGDGDAESK